MVESVSESQFGLLFPFFSAILLKLIQKSQKRDYQKPDLQISNTRSDAFVKIPRNYPSYARLAGALEVINGDASSCMVDKDNPYFKVQTNPFRELSQQAFCHPDDAMLYI